ncbi:hypothetical protein HDV04_005173 [Boothiomyces sp. JEL0838]|nr:hypothetical protein HDV04_005173 [Boothiomyces sp. JEL0838]
MAFIGYVWEDISLKTEKEFIFSPPFGVDEQWQLVVYPNGNKSGKSTHVSVYLYPYSTDPKYIPRLKVQCNISIGKTLYIEPNLVLDFKQQTMQGLPEFHPLGVSDSITINATVYSSQVFHSPNLNFFMNREKQDIVTIISKEKSIIKAHKNVLYQLEYFRNVLSLGSIILEDYDEFTILGMLEFMYSGRISIHQPTTIQQRLHLYNISFLTVNTLLSQYVSNILVSNHLNIDSVFDLLKLPTVDGDLQQKCEEFITNNIKDICKRPDVRNQLISLGSEKLTSILLLSIQD